MNELFGTPPPFGAATPIWTTMPTTSFGLQAPTVFGARGITSQALGAPTFGSLGSAGPPLGLPAASSVNPGVPAPSPVPATVYGLAGGMLPSAYQSFAAPAVATAYPYGFGSSGAMVGPEALGWVSPVSLLAAVAMRKGQPQGPTNDREVEDFIYDALEMLPGAADVEVRCEIGKVTLTGTVPDKRTKRDIGEIVWALSGINDLQNNVTIVSKRRQRPNREAEATPAVPARKQG